MSGKRATAPCGHAGEHVIGQYVRCLRRGCDGTPPAPAARCRHLNGVRFDEASRAWVCEDCGAPYRSYADDLDRLR